MEDNEERTKKDDGFGAEYWCNGCNEDCAFCEDYSSSLRPHPIKDR